MIPMIHITINIFDRTWSYSTIDTIFIFCPLLCKRIFINTIKMIRRLQMIPHAIHKISIMFGLKYRNAIKGESATNVRAINFCTQKSFIIIFWRWTQVAICDEAIATSHKTLPMYPHKGDITDKPKILSYEVRSQLILNTEKQKKRQINVTENQALKIAERILIALFQVALYKSGIEIMPFNARRDIP